MNRLTDGNVKFDLAALSVAWAEFDRIARLRPLDSEADYEHTLSLFTQVFNVAANKEAHPLGSLLSLLASLLEEYEKAHHSLGGDESEPHEMLAFMMEQGERTADDLKGILDHAELEAVLAGQRRIDGELAEKLAGLFGVPATLFLKQE